MEKLKRAGIYILTRVIVIGLVVGLLFSAFYSSMKTSNIYFLLNDALKARLDIILLKTDIEEKSEFFSYDYLTTQEYANLKATYSLYNISNYGHKLEYKGLFVWPWQKTKTVTVYEVVYAINGELDTTQMTKAEAMAMDVYNIPEWRSSVYKVKLKLNDGIWTIDSITRKGDYDYEAPRTPSLTKEEIDALRTPSPEPTVPPAPGESIAGREATISTPIRGDKVNLREGPATEYDILEQLENGAKITVLEESDGWYLVRTASGKEGYVSGYYIH